MAATGDYIPPRDADALIFFQNFRDLIAADPPRYGLLAGDSVQIAAVVLDFQQALPISVSNATSTPDTVAAKNIARTTCENLVRQYAMDVKFNDGVADNDKIALGVRPVNPDRTPVPVPTTSPALEVVSATPGVHTIRYSDPNNGNSKAKPFGADSLQLFVGLADADVLVTDPAQCTFYGAFKKNPIGVQFNATDNGKQATYYARWAGANGEFGPWSGIASLAVAA